MLKYNLICISENKESHLKLPSIKKKDYFFKKSMITLLISGALDRGEP